MVLLLEDIHWPEVGAGRRFGAAPAAVRGVFLAAPPVVVFGALFSAADVNFEHLVKGLVQVDPAELAVHLLVIGLIGWIVAGWGRQLLIESPWGNPASGHSSPLGIGMIEMGIALGAVDLLFLAFVVVQLGYFFGGATFVEGSASFTYAEYARRGFFELVWVAAISLPLLMAAHWAVRPAPGREERLFVGLAGAFVGLLFVIMASAMLRMALYTSMFGLTELRLYTSAFMGWLGLVFAWFVVTALRGQRQRFAVGAFVAGMVVLTVLDLANPDALIAEVNLGRTAVRSPDSGYLESLSADAVPTLVARLDALPASERQRLLGTMETRWASPPGDWRSWSWSRARAAEALAAAHPSLSLFDDKH